MAAIKSIKVGEITYDLKATYDGSGNNIAGTYAKSSAIPTKVSELSNDKNYLTEHQDISGLATKEQIDEKVDKELGKGLSEALLEYKEYLSKLKEIKAKVKEDFAKL